MKLWFRVEADASTDTKVARLADALRLPVAHAFGLTAGVWCGVARHADTGDLTGVTDASLETWAGWTGKRGRFAAEFRRLFIDPDNALHGWAQRQGRLIATMQKDRERHRRQYEESRRNLQGESPENPGSICGISERNTITITDTVQKDVVVIGGQTLDQALAEETAPTDVRSVAVLLTVAANQGITAKYGEQPVPIISSHPGSLAVAESIIGAGVPVLWARDAFYSAARVCALDRPPKSLKYFLAQVLARWESDRAAAEAKHAPIPNVIPLTTAERRGAALQSSIDKMLAGVPKEARQ